MNKNTLKKVFLADVPLFAVVALCAITSYVSVQLLGKSDSASNGKYLVAEKSAIILKAVLEHQGETPEELEKEIAAPILDVLKKYADQGYVVIDTGKDEHGNMTIAALPNGTRDISAELSAAIAKKKGPQ